MTLDANDLTVIGIVSTNGIILVSAWITTKIQITRLEVLVTGLEKDVNALGNLYREIKSGRSKSDSP